VGSPNNELISPWSPSDSLSVLDGVVDADPSSVVAWLMNADWVGSLPVSSSSDETAVPAPELP